MWYAGLNKNQCSRVCGCLICFFFVFSCHCYYLKISEMQSRFEYWFYYNRVSQKHSTQIYSSMWKFSIDKMCWFLHEIYFYRHAVFSVDSCNFLLFSSFVSERHIKRRKNLLKCRKRRIISTRKFHAIYRELIASLIHSLCTWKRN